MTIKKFKKIIEKEVFEIYLKDEFEKELKKGIKDGKIILERDFYNVNKSKNTKKIIEFLNVKNILKANDNSIITNDEIMFIVNYIINLLV